MALPVEPHQYTLKESISCCGVGLHSGRTANLTIRPASENSGIRFFRTDLGNGRYVRAHMDKAVDTRLATTIGEDGVVVSTTEHLLAALRGTASTTPTSRSTPPRCPSWTAAQPRFSG